MAQASQKQYVFGDFILVPTERQLLQAGTALKLRPKSFNLLQLLIERAGSLVTEDQILENVWPDQFVSPEGINVLVVEIRKVLGDSVKNPKFIETVPKAGYRFFHLVKPLLVYEAEHQFETNDLLSSQSQSPEPANEYQGRIDKAKKANRLDVPASPTTALTPPTEAFFTAVLPSDLELIDLASQSWRIDRPTEISRLITTAELDQPVRNSNRWLLRGRTDYFLRQILRKIPAAANRLTSKHRLLWWLRHKAAFSTECPIRPVVTWPEEHYCWAVPSASGAPFELYPLVRGTTFDQQDDKLDLLIELLVRLTDATRRLFTEHEDIAQSLMGRLTRFGVRPRYEQMESSLVSTAKEIQVLLTGMPCESDVESVSEEVIACFASHIGDPQFRQRLEQLRDKQPQRLVHGDLTENNLLVQKKRLWLFDWDNVSIQRSGPFDLAFALVRLANADRMGATLRPTGEEIQRAERMLKLFCDASPATVSEPDIALALEQVRFEFSLRMLEYFEVLIGDPSRPVDMPYVRRCNPGRPLAIRRRLTGSKL